MDKQTIIAKNLQDSIELKTQLLQNTELVKMMINLSDQICATFNSGGKVLFCGNGGSAADAQHLSAEFSGRYYYDRNPLFAEALHVNTSYMTAVANDYSYEEVYARLIKAMGRSGDMLIGLSTSGNSANVINAMLQAKKQGMTTVGFTGEGGGKMAQHSDFLIAIPSKNTPRIQEAHMILGHTLCEMVEMQLFPRD